MTEPPLILLVSSALKKLIWESHALYFDYSHLSPNFSQIHSLFHNLPTLCSFSLFPYYSTECNLWCHVYSLEHATIYWYVVKLPGVNTIKENQCSSSWQLPITTRSGCFISAAPLHVGISSAWARTALSPKWDIYTIPLLQRLREPLRRGRRERRMNGGARGGGWLQWIPVFQT